MKPGSVIIAGRSYRILAQGVKCKAPDCREHFDVTGKNPKKVYCSTSCCNKAVKKGGHGDRRRIYSGVKSKTVRGLNEAPAPAFMKGALSR